MYLRPKALKTVHAQTVLYSQNLAKIHITIFDGSVVIKIRKGAILFLKQKIKKRYSTLRIWRKYTTVFESCTRKKRKDTKM